MVGSKIRPNLTVLIDVLGKGDYYAMIWGLIIGLVGSILGGLTMFGVAKSAVHEIEGLLLFLMATIFFSTLAIVHAIKPSHQRSESPLPSLMEKDDIGQEHLLANLDTPRRYEVERYIKTLGQAGYSVIKLPREWEIVTSAGRIAHRVSTLEALRDVVSQLGKQSS